MTVKSHHHRPPTTVAVDAAARTQPKDVEKAKDGEAPARKPSDEYPVTRVSVLLAHLTWLLLGPLALLLTLCGIVSTGSGWAALHNALFLVLIALIMWCRWFDQRSGQGTTVNGEPSTWADFRRYALLMPAVAGAAWIVANVIGNHGLTM